MLYPHRLFWNNETLESLSGRRFKETAKAATTTTYGGSETQYLPPVQAALSSRVLTLQVAHHFADHGTVQASELYGRTTPVFG